MPKSKEKDGVLGPYQIQRRLITKEIETAFAQGSSTAYDLEDMVRDLERVHKDIHGDESEDESKNDSDNDSKIEKAYPMFTKQFKGMCRRCGQMGHKARDCDKQR